MLLCVARILDLKAAGKVEKTGAQIIKDLEEVNRGVYNHIREKEVLDAKTY